MKTLLSKQQMKWNIKRLFAYLIDWYIVSVLAILPINVVFSMTFQTLNVHNSLAQLPLPQAAGACLCSLILALLYLVILPYKTNGQTLGKRIFHLRIVKCTAATLDLKTLLLRNGIGLLLLEGTLFSCSTYLWELLNMAVFPSFTTFTLPLFTLIVVGSILISLGTTKHKMLHDYLSDTYVAVSA